MEIPEGPSNQVRSSTNIGSKFGQHSGNPMDPHKPKQKVSVFLLTINTQQVYKRDDQATAYGQSFEQILNEMFNEQNLGNFVTFLEDPNYQGQQRWESPFVEESEIGGGVERGTNGAIHAHLIVKIVHRTKLQLDRHAISTYLTQQLGVTPHIDIKHNNGAAAMEAYVRKQQQ